MEGSSMHAKNRLTELAEAVYSQVFGHLDDKYFESGKVTEIYDWLESGDLTDDQTAEALAAEWREYDAADVAANPAPGATRAGASVAALLTENEQSG